MNKEFISYEQALALKELGFDEPCLGNYRLPTNRLITEWEIKNTPEHTLGISAPLYQQAFRWFRKRHNFQSSIEATKDQHRFELGFNYFIWNTKTGKEWHTEPKDRPAGDYVFNTYEEAEFECLNKLIKLIKK
jgi:hypothetical protein